MKVEKQPITVYKDSMMELPLEKEKTFIKINCPSCGCETASSDINLDQQLAKCSGCNAVYSVKDNIELLTAFAKENVDEIPRPVGIDVYYYKDEMDLEIEQPWSVMEIIGISFLPLVIFMMTFLYFAKDIPMAWPIGAWMLGIYGIISLFGRKNHKVFVSITDKTFDLVWKPNKWMQAKSFKTQEIKQLYVAPVNGSYHLKIITEGVQGQKHHTLLGGMTSPTKAKYLEQEIEKFLGIPDKRVPEEKGNAILYGGSTG